MKIRTQSRLLLLFGMIVIAMVIYLTNSQLEYSKRVSLDLQTHQEGLVRLSTFQEGAINLILLGVDLIRTEDISGNRIVPYRMTETRFKREIGYFESLEGIDGEIRTQMNELSRMGQELYDLCKEEMMDPLYNHQELNENIIERLIYEELDRISGQVNAIRSELNVKVDEAVVNQSRLKRRFVRVILPLMAFMLLSLLFLSFLTIRRALKYIVITGKHFGDLAEGKSRLDLSMPEYGNDEITQLRKNFNRFIANLSRRHRALTEISQRHVESGERLNDLAQEHSAAVTQLKQGLNRVNNKSENMSHQVHSTLAEIRNIAGVLNALEQMSGQLTEKVAAMIDRSERVNRSLRSQTSSVEAQVILTHRVKEESHNNKRVLELLRTQIREMGEQSDEIFHAIGSIQDLADQTEILAINASIESAHAGVYGKGFAVVADEMGRLSRHVRSHSRLITELLEKLNEKLGLMAMEEKENQESIERLIRKNDLAEEAIDEIKLTQDEIKGAIDDFLGLLNKVGSGAEEIHDRSDQVRCSSMQIEGHMEDLNLNQKELLDETREMNQGTGQLSKGIGTLSELSDQNSHTASTLSKELEGLGKP